MIQALTALRNQLTIKHDEPPLSVSDERLVLAKEWLGSFNGVDDLFSVWETTNAVGYRSSLSLRLLTSRSLRDKLRLSYLWLASYRRFSRCYHRTTCIIPLRNLSSATFFSRNGRTG